MNEKNLDERWRRGNKRPTYLGSVRILDIFDEMKGLINLARREESQKKKKKGIHKKIVRDVYGHFWSIPLIIYTNIYISQELMYLMFCEALATIICKCIKS